MVLHHGIVLDSPLRWVQTGRSKKTPVRKEVLKTKPGPKQSPSVRGGNVSVEYIPAPQKLRKIARVAARRHVVRERADQTILQQAAVSKRCRDRYLAHCEQVKGSLTVKCGKLRPATQVDRLLADHLERLYKEGRT